MTTITFAQIAKDFLKSAEDAKIPRHVATGTLDIFRPSYDTSFAFAEALRWSNALPNDPAGNAPIEVIAGNFKTATAAWAHSRNILEGTFGLAQTPEQRQRAAAVVQKLDWGGLRGRIAGSIPNARVPSKAVLEGLDAHVGLAQSGKIEAAVGDSISRLAKTTKICTDLYEEILREKRPVRRKKNWDDYWDAAGSAVAGVAAGGCTWYAYGQAVAAGSVTAAAVVTSPGWATIAAFGAVVTGLSMGMAVGYYHR